MLRAARSYLCHICKACKNSFRYEALVRDMGRRPGNTSQRQRAERRLPEAPHDLQLLPAVARAGLRKRRGQFRTTCEAAGRCTWAPKVQVAKHRPPAPAPAPRGLSTPTRARLQSAAARFSRERLPVHPKPRHLWSPRSGAYARSLSSPRHQCLNARLGAQTARALAKVRLLSTGKVRRAVRSPPPVRTTLLAPRAPPQPPKKSAWPVSPHSLDAQTRFGGERFRNRDALVNVLLRGTFSLRCTTTSGCTACHWNKSVVPFTFPLKLTLRGPIRWEDRERARENSVLSPLHFRPEETDRGISAVEIRRHRPCSVTV